MHNVQMQIKLKKGIFTAKMFQESEWIFCLLTKHGLKWNYYKDKNYAAYRIPWHFKKPITEWNLFTWFQEPWRWQTTSAMGKRPLTDGLMLRTRQKISRRIKMESWADVSPSQTNSLCRATHLLLGKPNYLGICFQQPPATLDRHSKAKADVYIKSPAKHE